MNKIARIICIILAVAFLAACGDEAYTTNNNAPSGRNPPTGPKPGPGPGKPEPSIAASITLEAPSENMGSGRNSTLDLSARVLDENQVRLEGEKVIFSITSNGGGALQVLNNGMTSVNGIASAILSTDSDPANRTITVTASVNGFDSSFDAKVSGTTITLSGDTTMALDSTTTLTIFLKDSSGVGIASQPVSIISEANNFPPQFINTGADGQAQFDITIQQPVDDKITVEALGAQSVHLITISNDQFIFDPIIPAELKIDTVYKISVNLKTSGRPVAGVKINFSASRGTIPLPSPSTTTDINGNAFATISSKSAGPVVLTAFATDGPIINFESEFVALIPDSLNIQANQITLGPNGQQSIITATVRDANNNLVKNVPILFSIIEDNSGGSILNTISVTDSSGNASTIYKSNTPTTAQNGVVIRARVQNTLCGGTTPNSQLCADIKLTVSERALFVTLGTSNKIRDLTPTDYTKEYSVRVTDATGNVVPNATVELTLIPIYYRTGLRVWDPVNSGYSTRSNVLCQSEDLNRDGNNDAGEDINGNNNLDPGNVAGVTKSIITNDRGYAIINIDYSKDHAEYVDVQLTATAKVAGTEGTSVVTFTLPISVDDIKKIGTVPGPFSPFGELNNCIESAQYTGPDITLLNVAITPSGTVGELLFSWDSLAITGVYKVYRSKKPGINIYDSRSYDAVIQTGLPPFVDNGLTTGTIYYYVVTALTARQITVSESGPSLEVNATAP